jgi:WD40 repeat protein
LVTGADPGEGRDHFGRRARGQLSAARGGDFFRGRSAARERIGQWLDAGEPPGQPLVVTGQPGAGKSAVLAKAALPPGAEREGPGLAFYARDATAVDFLSALAAVAGADPQASVDELVACLAGVPAVPPIRVVVDALDEAASDNDQRRIAQALSELAVLPGLRVAVATRRRAVGPAYPPGGLLACLGVTGPDDPSLVDLDAPAYADGAGLRQFAAAMLAQEAANPPVPPDGAWTAYRAQPELRDQLAGIIAERAGGSYLVAAVYANQLSKSRTVTDPAGDGSNVSSLPAGIGDALDRDLGRLPDGRHEHALGLLTALGYVRGTGLDDQAWLAFAAALGYTASVADLDALRRSPAADYIQQAAAVRPGAGPVTSLFHQALADELLAPRNQSSDQSALFDMLLNLAAHTGWQDQYLQAHAAAHAAAAGRLDELFDDPLYLITVDPPRLLPYLDTAQSASARTTAAVYWQCSKRLALTGPPGRASQLELTAHQAGYPVLAARIADAVPDRPWRTLWADVPRATSHQILTGHRGWLQAVTTGTLPDGTPVIISSGADETIRVWRLADGTPIGEPLRGYGIVSALAAGALPDGTAVIIAGDARAVRVWRLADGTPVGDPMPAPDEGVCAVATGTLPDSTAVIVAGCRDETVRVWRLADGTPVGQPMRDNDRGFMVHAVTTGTLPDGTPVIISGSGYGTVRVWRLADQTPVGQPVRGHDNGVFAVATASLPDGTPVIISGGGDKTVRVWRLADGTLLGEPMRGHDGWVLAVTTGTLPDGTPVIISAGSDWAVRVWRLADGTPLGEPMRGHDGWVNAVAAGSLPDGTPVIISGGADRAVRVWRPADSTPSGQPRQGHAAPVSALATADLPDGTGIIVSGSADGTVLVWRLADGSLAGKPVLGHDGEVFAAATAALPDGTPVVITSGADSAVRVWRLPDGTPVGEPLRGHDGSVLSVAAGMLPDGTPVIITGGADETVRVWRLTDRTSATEPIRGSGGVNAVTAATLPDGTPVIISGSSIGMLQVWRLADGTPIGEPIPGHEGWVTALTAAALPDGTPVIISGGDDGTVRRWHLADGTPIGEPLSGPRGLVSVASAALPDGTPVIISSGGSADRTLRAWRLADGSAVGDPLALAQSITRIAVQDNVIVASTGMGIAVCQPRFTPSGFD